MPGDEKREEKARVHSEDYFGDGRLGAADVAAGIVGAVVKDPVHDSLAWREYLEAVVRDRAGWGDFYDACREL